MATDTGINQASKISESLIRDLTHASRMLAKVGEQLSNAGLDKFAKQLKETLKAEKLVTDEMLDRVKSAKDLEKVLNKLEDQFDDTSKELEKFDKEVLRLRRQSKMSHEQAHRVAQQKLKIDRAELAAHQAKMYTIREEIQKRGQNIKLGDKFGQGLAHATGNLRGFAASVATFGGAMKLLHKGFTQLYADSVKLSHKGMLGSLSTVQTGAFKLQMSPAAVEELINQNRDLVNIMGGGTGGVAALIDEIANAREGLDFLGRDAAKAGARFISLSKNIGLTRMDGPAYKKNLEATNKNFTKFSGLFGDSYDQYSAFIEELANEETLRRRLNGLNKDQIFQEMEELRTRALNLRAMGLSTQQITELGKKVGDLLDPRKNNMVERFTQTSFARSADSMMMQMIGARPELAGLQKQFQGAQGGLDKVYGGIQSRMSKPDFEKLLASKEVADALKIRDQVKAAIDRTFKQEQVFGLNQIASLAGTVEELIAGTGRQMQTAAQSGLNLSPAQVAAGEQMAAAKEIAKGFSLVTRGIGLAEAALGNWVTTLIGAGLALGGSFLTLKLSAIAASIALGKVGMGIPGVSGAAKPGSLGKLAGGATKLALAGSIGYMGGQLSDLAWEKVTGQSLSSRIAGFASMVNPSDAEQSVNAMLRDTYRGDISGLDSSTRSRFESMAAEYKKLTGNPIQVNSAHRTSEQQARLYNDWINRGKTGLPAAPPGSSLHEKGLALDINANTAKDLENRGLLNRHGFVRPLPATDPVHIQDSSASGRGDPVMGMSVDELRKHTSLLMAIANNTSERLRPSGDAYKPSPADAAAG